MRRTIQFDTLDDVLAEAQRLQTSGYDRAGNWSLGQVCNHLAAAVDMFAAQPARLIPGPVQRLMQGAFLHTTVLGKFGNALGLRLPTIKPQNRPVDDAEGVQRLQESFLKLRHAGADHLIPFHLWHSGHHFSFLIPQSESDVAKAVEPAKAKTETVSSGQA